MTLPEALAVAAAGALAGGINTVAGGGSLVSFPTLLAVGLPPLTANVTSIVGLLPGSVGGTVGYRRELAGQRARIVRLSVPAVLGSVAGAAALLLAPGAFAAIVPGLVALSCLLLLLQPRLSRLVRRVDGEGSAGLAAGLFGAGAYAAYFGSAVSVLLLALVALWLDDDLQRLNALKVVLALVATVLAAAIYVAVAPVNWPAAGVLAVTSWLGGHGAAGLARRLPSDALRVGVAVAGLVVAVVLAVT
jgi:uncharacterized membrane protein YfcA